MAEAISGVDSGRDAITNRTSVNLRPTEPVLFQNHLHNCSGEYRIASAGLEDPELRLRMQEARR